MRQSLSRAPPRLQQFTAMVANARPPAGTSDYTRPLIARDEYVDKNKGTPPTAPGP